jgi:type I restriction enzyme, R subunit
MPAIAESHVEEATLAWLGELGFAAKAGPDIGPDGAAPERRAHRDVVLAGRARAAIARPSPRLTAETREAVFRKLIS